MSSPVLIDDGGSFRIRQLKNDVTMDGLIGTWTGAATVFTDSSADAFAACTVVIHYNTDPGGAQHAVPAAALNAGDTVVIQSTNGQVATVVFNPGAPLTITLSNSNAGGPDPAVEARHFKRKRRYTVANAGAIDTVTVISGGAAAVTFSAAGTPSVYTLVHFS